MEEMTRGPSVDSSETADDLNVQRQTPQDLSLMKVKEEESVKNDTKEEPVKISENSISTTSPTEDSPKARENDGRNNSPELSRMETLFSGSDLTQKHLSSGNVTPPSRLNYNFFRNPEDTDTPVRPRPTTDYLDVPKSHRVVPKELKLRESGRGVWAREKIPKGTRYGPFLGKWVSDPVDARFAWEVSFIYLFIFH